MSIRKQYDTDLESLKNSLTEMGRNSADAVENALEALCVADADAAAAIVKGDARINNMERDIEHRCMTLLLRQQPVAGDLRRISTAMKVVTDIERIGDHAADIAEIIPHLVTVRKEGDPAVSQAIAMGKKAHQMILDALAALTAEDENAARRVIAADDEVDYDFNAIKHQLAQEIAEDPGKVEGNPVFTYIDAFATGEHFKMFLPEYENAEQLKAHYKRGGLGDVKIKKFLSKVLRDVLAPVYSRREQWQARMPEVFEILKKGTLAARKKAASTLAAVRKAMKIDYFD